MPQLVSAGGYVILNLSLVPSCHVLITQLNNSPALCFHTSSISNVIEQKVR